MFAHLARLASLSPHLLQDMGFVEVTDHGTQNLQILRKGPLTVSIQKEPGYGEPIIIVTQGSDEPIDKT